MPVKRTNNSMIAVTVMVPVTIHANSRSVLPDLVRELKNSKLVYEMSVDPTTGAGGWFTLDTKRLQLKDISNRWLDAANRIRSRIPFTQRIKELAQ